MTMIALLLALLLERLLTQVLHLREAGWMDAWYQWLRARVGSGAAGCVFGLLLPVLPVAAVALTLDRWLPSTAWVVFAALVLVFSLGPRDLFEEVEDYVAAEATGDGERAGRAAATIIEHDARQRRAARASAVEDAIFVQSNNRLFGVLFWFVLLGPTALGPVAAWLFRASDLLRRAALADAPSTGLASCFERIHFILAWVPARLVALTFALAGSFEQARSEVRAAPAAHWLERNDLLLMRAGRGALAGTEDAEAGPAGPARDALRLVRRTLLIWLTAIALLSLAAWVA